MDKILLYSEDRVKWTHSSFIVWPSLEKRMTESKASKVRMTVMSADVTRWVAAAAGVQSSL